MQLHFLGQTYFASNNSVKTTASEKTACFLGQRYTLRRPVQIVKSQLDTRKKYRGVVY